MLAIAVGLFVAWALVGVIHNAPETADLFYVPILLAAWSFGLPGGVVVVREYARLRRGALRAAPAAAAATAAPAATAVPPTAVPPTASPAAKAFSSGNSIKHKKITRPAT